jgi:hypothetical protein
MSSLQIFTIFLVLILMAKGNFAAFGHIDNDLSSTENTMDQLRDGFYFANPQHFRHLIPVQAFRSSQVRLYIIIIFEVFE